MPFTKSTFVIYVNGRKIIDENIDPEVTLLKYLRKKLFLTGSKEGCSEGGCGACTVMVSKYERISGQIEHYTVNACLTLVVSLHGMAVTTVEGIGSLRNGLHPVQERLAKAHGSQCGFCTPGFVMSMYTLLRNSPQPSIEDIEANLSGNLCRCTGYRPILEGFRTFCSPSTTLASGLCSKGNCCKLKTNAGEELIETEILFDPGMFKPYDPSQDVIFPPELKLTVMGEEELHFKGPRVEFFCPISISSLLKIKSLHPESRLMAGNTEIGVQVNCQNKRYPVIIDISKLNELKMIKQNNTYVEVGSSATLSKIAITFESIIKQLPLHSIGVLSAVVGMLKRFASKQIRNIATMGGNIMHGSPISDLIPILMASDSTITLKSQEEEREVCIMNFYTGNKANIAKPSEVLLSIKLPCTEKNEYFKAFKQSRRREDDLAIVNAAFRVKFEEGSNLVSGIWMAYGGMAATAVMPKETMKLLQGHRWDASLLDLASSSLLEELQLDTDAPGGMIDYRRTLTISLFYKFYQEIRLILNKQNPSLSKPLTESDISATTPMRIYPLESMQFFQNVPADQEPIDPIGRPVACVSCLKQTTGEAEYTDDIPSFENELYAVLVTSTKAKAKIVNIDESPAMKVEGVRVFFSAKDLPVNRMRDEKECEHLPSIQVDCIGQIVGIIVADSPDLARQAASLVDIEYEDLPDPVITIQDAIEKSSYFDILALARGDVEDGFKRSDFVIEGDFQVGGQEHFYLEPHSHLVIPRDSEELEAYSSIQCPSQLQMEIAHALSLAANKITCKVKRIGGAFGGKDIPSICLVVPLALASQRTKSPVRLVLSRQEDMLITGGRHPMFARWKVGFQKDGKIISVKLDMYLNAGWSNQVLSSFVMLLAIFKLEGPYKIANWDIKGYCCKTNLPSNGAFRGFGGPQSALLMENILTRVADHLSLDSKLIKERNFHSCGDSKLSGTKLDEDAVEQCWKEVLEKSDYEGRRRCIEEFNRSTLCLFKCCSLCKTTNS